MPKTYAEKLRDPRWREVRERILKRDNNQCQFCYSSEKSLHIHHRIYKFPNEPWEYPDTNFVTYCEECHAQEEVSKEHIKSMIEEILVQGGCYLGIAQAFETQVFDPLVNIYKHTTNGKG